MSARRDFPCGLPILSPVHVFGSYGWDGGDAVTMKGKCFLASFSDAEVLWVLKPGVTLYSSPGSPIQSVPDLFSQPSEVQATYDAFKGMMDAANPDDGKKVVDARNAQRQIFNETMGNFLDLVALGARKDPSLPAKFSMSFVEQGKSRPASKTAQLLAVPLLLLQAIDKEPGTVRCKVRGGVKKGIEIQNTYDDPSNEANWNHLESFVSGTFAMMGLFSGRRTYVRGRYLFGQGQKGPWSEMVSVMVP